MKVPPPLNGLHPGLALLALLAAVAESTPDTEGAERPKCGHEVRADREAVRADYLTKALGSVQRQLRGLIASTQRVSEADLLPLVEAIGKDLAHADELTRPPEPTQAKQAAGEQANATEARPADPLAELPPDLRRGVLTTIHALGQLPLPPGAVATLTLSRTRQD